ncbi:hypothetical protein VNI00_002789 [Paramarasmius palmivorus]|uniref:Uncharacterized protein n=1 Tax=Paramarasmius palmivorus TaxID=297713 RepID=A0AAW0DY80_9AGAR
MPFKLNFTSDNYFKTRSKSITVLLSKTNPPNFGVELGELTPTGIRAYVADLTPKFSSGPGWDKKGDYTLTVIEQHTADFGTLDAISIFSQQITFTD